jgi:hypothetical protein
MGSTDRRLQPFRDKALRERYLESLRDAGLPA